METIAIWFYIDSSVTLLEGPLDMLSFAIKCFNYTLIIFQVISTWGVQNNIDFLSLSYTRHAEDVRHVSSFPVGHYGLLFSFYFLHEIMFIVNVHVSHFCPISFGLQLPYLIQ